jgi:hypothetical protein
MASTELSSGSVQRCAFVDPQASPRHEMPEHQRTFVRRQVKHRSADRQLSPANRAVTSAVTSEIPIGQGRRMLSKKMTN